MEHEIINCYEMDIRQDIPVEMESLRMDNESLLNTNLVLRITLISIGLGVILFAVYHSSNTRIREVGLVY